MYKFSVTIVAYELALYIYIYIRNMKPYINRVMKIIEGAAKNKILTTKNGNLALISKH